MHLLVTGGAGFIGVNFTRSVLERHPGCRITVLDKLTYAANRDSLRDLESNPRFRFVQGDICDRPLVSSVMEHQHVDAVVHFAAESHVDRSINDASPFVTTNVLGTSVLLEAALQNDVGRFIHVSTDEVYGSISTGSFRETDLLHPSSPYSASKAGSDLLALAFYRTHGLPVVITRCCNNFGPYQFPEKLIPLFITNLLDDKSVPVYGDGKNIREWIYVEDHCSALAFLLNHGEPGEIYNVGSGTEQDNLAITTKILAILDKPNSYIEFVKDRPGHDFRYALDSGKLRALGWEPRYSFEDALRSTVAWYRDNAWWWRPLKTRINPRS